jgi:hypothetical protein
MKNKQTLKHGAVPTMLAIAAIGLGLAANPATATQEHKFSAVVDSFTYADFHAGYSIWDHAGTGTVVGDFTAESGGHFSHGYTKIEGWWTIAAANGDLLYMVFEQTGSFETGYWAGPYKIVGGTGRFANASGTGTIVVISDASRYPVSGSFHGTISF